MLRYRRYKVGQDPENFYREQVLLLLPFRNESEEIEGKDCEKLYFENLVTIQRNGETFGITNDERLEETLESVQNNENGRDMEDEQEENVNYPVDIFEQGGIGGGREKEKDKTVRHTTPKRVSPFELQALVDKLNVRQKEFVDYVLNCFKNNETPLKVHLSGKGGTGKSLVVNALFQSVTDYFDNLPGGDKDKVVVLLCAPSGKAAFLINGVTFTHCFCTASDSVWGSDASAKCRHS